MDQPNIVDALQPLRHVAQHKDGGDRVGRDTGGPLVDALAALDVHEGWEDEARRCRGDLAVIVPGEVLDGWQDWLQL
jgi:hypothetical protein